MRTLLAFALIIALAGAAVAADLGNRAPAKPDVTYPVNVPDPDRQGGDTILDAVPVTIPVSGSGTTAGYTDDYDEVCPYSQSTSPDVVYTFTPDMDMSIYVDLCGSSYDTKTYIYDENLALIACNDDFYFDDVCGVYVSKIEEAAVMAGVQYYVIVDGYGGDFGDYVIEIDEVIPCVVDCPAGAELEGEPPLEDGYVDMHNGGCNTDPNNPVFGSISSDLYCGVSGWYLFEGSNYRDTDWFEIEVPNSGFIEILGDAEYATYMFELAPQDCNDVAVVQQVVIGPCVEGTMIIPGNPGDMVWFWVGPTIFDGPSYGYDYVLLTNLVPFATESHSWSSVKTLFD